MKVTPSTEKGFTLLEILAAMAILSIGLLGMTLLILGVIRGNLTSEKNTIAATLAQDQMEKVKGLGYDHVVNETQNYNTITNFPSFKRVTAVTSNTPAAGMKTVTVTVYWNSDSHSLAVSTILAP